jgi:hypothetical protein
MNICTRPQYCASTGYMGTIPVESHQYRAFYLYRMSMLLLLAKLLCVLPSGSSIQKAKKMKHCPNVTDCEPEGSYCRGKIKLKIIKGCYGYDSNEGGRYIVNRNNPKGTVVESKGYRDSIQVPVGSPSGE